MSLDPALVIHVLVTPKTLIQFNNCFRTPVNSNKKIIELLFLNQISFKLGDIYAFTNFKEILRYFRLHLFVNDSLGNSIENQSQETTDGKNYSSIKTNNTELHCRTKQGTNDLIVIDD